MKKVLKYTVYSVLAVLIAFNIGRIFQLDLQDDAPSDYRSLFIGGKFMFDDTRLFDTLACQTRWSEIVAEERLNSSSSPGQIHIAALTYPPHAYPIFSFNRWLSWKQGRVVWWTVCFMCFGLLLYWLRNGLLIALALGFKGSFFAILLGQPMLLVVSAMVLLLQYFKRNAFVIFALLLVVALMKFTLVIPLIIWLTIKRKWNILFATGLFSVVIYSIFHFSYPSIIQDYVRSASTYYNFIYSNATSNLYPSLNSELTSLINVFIQLPMTLVKSVNIAGQLLGFGFAAFLFFRKRIDDAWLLYLLYLVSFLFSYHLIYDALVLLIPIALIHLNRPVRDYIYLLPFILLSMPWNTLANYVPILQYHFPMLLILALFMALYDRLILE